ncbi:MAG: PPC domain-containing protein, partial [Gemmatimonadota bacterium]|nr:PPC domain-containing protein [Gemmatimonadota bacterium]
MMIAHRVLFGAALVSMVAAPVCAQDEYLEQIEGQIEAVDELMVEEGFHPILRMFSGTLAAGETERLTLRFEDGVAFQVVGVCDTDCSDLDLTLYDPSGNEVAEDVLPDDFPMLEFAARIAGAYTLEVAMPGCSSEPCYWGVQAYGEQASGGGRSAGESTSYQGELRFGDEQLSGGEYFDVYAAEASAGALITVDLRSSDFDTYLIVRSPSGENHDNDDFEGSTDLSRLEIEATESGMWEIVATAYEEGMRGEYALEVTVERASGGASTGTAGGVRRETGSLAPGDETLGSGEYVDDYYFTGSAGEEVIIDLRAVDFDPYLLIVAPDDEQEENDDYEGDVSRSLVRFTLPMSGEYRVAVTSYAPDETGRYDLSIRQGVAGADASGPVSERGTLAAGDETLRTGEYVDEFTFEGRPGEHVTVNLRSSDFDTYVMLLGPGEFRHENDDAEDDVGHSLVEADLSDAGTYRVLVTSYSPDQTGGYELRIDRGEVVAGAGQRDVQRLE